MARSIEEIREELIEEKNKNKHLSSLDNDNPTSLWRNIYYTIATGIHTMESVWDKMKAEIEKLISSQISGTLPWYVARIKEFQAGFDFDENTGKFKSTWKGISGTDPERVATAKEIEDSKVVAYASAEQKEVGRTVILKIINKDRLGLPDSVVNTVKSYIDKIKFAGTSISIRSLNPDSLEVDVIIHRTTPYLLNEDGTSVVDNTTNVIREGIKTYVRSIGFNGEFTVQGLVDVLQAIDGVGLVEITKIEAKDNNDISRDIVLKDIAVSGFYNVGFTKIKAI